MLTIITPVHCTSRNDYLYQRTKYFIENAYIDSNIERIIVDFGSLDSIMEEFKTLSKNKGIEFYSLGLKGESFSAGLCRNYGVTKAKKEFITFQDVDLYAPQSIYKSILLRLSSSKEYNYIESVPCLYLSEDYTEEYKKRESWDDAHNDAYQNYQLKTPSIQMYAPVTSMILTRRRYFMECGGNNNEFHGHGYEDFEALNRLANRANKFVRSRDYYNHDFKYDSPHFCGYRPFFSLFGRQLMNERVFFVHFWHPHNIAPSYAKRNKDNKIIFERLIRRFDKENYMPPALSGDSHYYDGKSLILSPFNGKTANSLRVAIPFLGECVYAKDTEFKDENVFLDFIKKNMVRRVLFFNSYGNDHRLNLYHVCQLNKIKTINFDRGGLPHTWFFDPHGFNYSSHSYNPNNWDLQITKDERESVQEYIINVLSSNDTLEKNGTRIGAHNFKTKYNILNKKILFVPLQRPNDSVIRHFSDEIRSVQNFLNNIVALAKSIKDKGWVVIVKQHPLEESTEIEEKENLIVLKPTDHFYDAINSSDAVMLINSGVGLYSLMAGKPTYNVGNAYYCHAGLSIKIKNPEDFKKCMNDLSYPSKDKVEKFIHYLITRFYSFGKTNYIEIVDPKTKSKTTNATYVDFENIKIPLDNGIMHEINISRRKEPFKINSVYFDYYRSGISLRDEIEKYKKNISDLNSLINKLKTNRTTKIIEEDTYSNKDTHTTNIVRTGAMQAKLKKLNKHPYLFFKDAIKKYWGKNKEDNN